VALQLAHHQLHVDLLARDIPHAQPLAHGHARVLLAVRDRERHRDLLRVVQWRDALEERAHVRVRLVAVLAPPLVAPSVRRVLEEGRPMGDAKIGQSARELGRKMYERGLICSFSARQRRVDDTTKTNLT
jgi:hypothetical protein